jgi:hypothetical protein
LAQMETQFNDLSKLYLDLSKRYKLSLLVAKIEGVIIVLGGVFITGSFILHF